MRDISTREIRELRKKAFSSLFPLISFFVPLTLYMVTLAPSVLNDDAAEYQTILPALGVAHPTGYPLYTLLGHLFTRITPFGDMAYRVNLFSAVAGAGTIAVLYLLLCELRVAPLLALLGALAFAVSADMWTYATIAQTYALNLLLIALALFAVVRYQQRCDLRSLIALAFVSGLGVTHHSTFWLFLPALVLFLIFDFRLLISKSKTALAIAAFLLPLSLYGYIPLRGEQLRALIPGDVLGYPRFVTDGWVTAHYLPGWTNVVIGSFYASSTIEGSLVDWVQAVGEYLYSLIRQFGLEALILLGAPLAFWRRHRRFGLLLGAAWLLTSVIVMRGVAAFNEPAGGLYTPTYLFAMMGIIVTIDTIARGSGLYRLRVADLRSWLRPSRTAGLDARLIVVIGVLIFMIVSYFIGNAGAHSPHARPDWRRQALAQLGQMPPHAVVLGAWSEITPLHYVQIIESVRQDVSVMHAPLTAEVMRALGSRARAEGRPLYLLRPSGELSLVTIP